MDPPECPVCGGTERDPAAPACWHCVRGHYADCQWNRDVARRRPHLSGEEARVWRRLTELLPDEEILRRLGPLRDR
jgi:hypothetical protein